jgi:hypothetical protein
MELKVGSIYRKENGNTCIIVQINDTAFCGRLFYDNSGNTYDVNGKAFRHDGGDLVEELLPL